MCSSNNSKFRKQYSSSKCRCSRRAQQPQGALPNSNRRNGETVSASAVEHAWITSKRCRKTETTDKNLPSKNKTAVSRMNGRLAEILDPVETDGVMKVEGILRKRLLLETKKMRQGEQRLVQCVGEVHGL